MGDVSVKKPVTGSIFGFIIVLAIGFALYFILSLIGGAFDAGMTYDSVVTGISTSFIRQLVWFFMNWTEPQFYGGMIAGIGLILGGFVAYILAKKNSKLAGFDICYGSSNVWPWVFASQVISIGLAVFVFRYINIISLPEVAWVATFITVAGAPPSLMLMYGPSVKVLLTVSILGGLLSPPIATWLANYVTTPLGVHGVVANVFTMVITGLGICSVCRILPWIKKVPIKDHRKTEKPAENVYSAKWFVRRCIADFSEAPFYGNEVTSIFLLVAIILEWIISPNLVSGGSLMVPAIILSQFVGSAVGVLLYAGKFDNGGWYATYVPVVSVGPACVLVFGGGIHIAVIAGVIGGILGGPFAEFFARHLPEDIHPTSANVASMGICTIIVTVVIKYLLGF